MSATPTGGCGLPPAVPGIDSDGDPYMTCPRQGCWTFCRSLAEYGQHYLLAHVLPELGETGTAAQAETIRHLMQEPPR